MQTRGSQCNQIYPNRDYRKQLKSICLRNVFFHAYCFKIVRTRCQPKCLSLQEWTTDMPYMFTEMLFNFKEGDTLFVTTQISLMKLGHHKGHSLFFLFHSPTYIQHLKEKQLKKCKGVCQEPGTEQLGVAVQELENFTWLRWVLEASEQHCVWILLMEYIFGCLCTQVCSCCSKNNEVIIITTIRNGGCFMKEKEGHRLYFTEF